MKLFNWPWQKAIFRLALLIVVVLGSCTSCFAEAGRITDIRFWQSPEEAQIVMDITAPPKVTPVSRLRDGTLYFDVEKCLFRPGRQRYPLDNPFLDVITVQQRTTDVVRIFFRVPAGVEAKTFVLPRNEQKGDRIVIFLREPQSSTIERRQAELSEVARLRAENVKIVVLDPGHGGEDPGTNNNGILEKEYVLAMGRLIKAYFDRDPRFKAILTRDGDYIIPLARRREIAEHLGADAFVSLHVNYNPRPSIRGVEVYYESPRGAVGEAERLVAEKENQVDFAGSTPTKPADLRREIVELQAATMNLSRQLAEKVDGRMSVAVSQLPSRGVRRAGFKVLHSMKMPSVLLEFGYTSNINDVKVLKNYTDRTKLAQSVYLGVRDFLLGKIEPGLDTSYLDYLKSAEARRQTAQAKRRSATKYVVKKGDTLSGIASKHKISLSALTKLNKINKTHIIKVGQTLLIPPR